MVVPSASAAPVSVTFDTRALASSLATFDIVQGGTGSVVVPSRSTATVQELDLDPATYTLRAPAGGGSGAVTLPFTSLPLVCWPWQAPRGTRRLRLRRPT